MTIGGSGRIYRPFVANLMRDWFDGQPKLHKALEAKVRLAWRAAVHRIVYAASTDAARAAYTAFERTWAKRCPGVVTSLREGGAELLTFFRFPKAQSKTLRTTNVIERLHEEFRRRVKTQGSLPGEEAAVVLLFSLVASGQIKLRRIDGWRKIAAVFTSRASEAA